MTKNQIRIGGTYIVKVSGILAQVYLLSAHPSGGWVGRNIVTKKTVRIRTAARLRKEVDPIIPISLCMCGQPWEPIVDFPGEWPHCPACGCV